MNLCESCQKEYSACVHSDTPLDIQYGKNVINLVETNDGVIKCSGYTSMKKVMTIPNQDWLKEWQRKEENVIASSDHIHWVREHDKRLTKLFIKKIEEMIRKSEESRSWVSTKGNYHIDLIISMLKQVIEGKKE